MDTIDSRYRDTGGSTDTQPLVVNADHYSITVGRVVIDVSSGGVGSIKADGVDIRARKVSLEIEAGEPPRLVVHMVP